MIKNGVLIQQDYKCFLCGKKGFKEIKDDVNILDMPLKKIVLKVLSGKHFAIP